MNCLIDTWRRLVARSRQICGHAWFLARRHHPERLQPLAILLLGLKPWEEANLVRDQLCPRVENCWDLTLNLNTHLSKLLYMKPNPTRDDLRLNRRPAISYRIMRRVSSAKLYHGPAGAAGNVFYLNTGDDLLGAETILQGVVQRRRQVFDAGVRRRRGRLVARAPRTRLFI